MTKNTSIAKIASPVPGDILERERLYSLLDKRYPVSWISSPGGSGKTTLTASYLRARNIPHIWYRLDSGDGDIATFFHYLGLAAKKAAPRRKKELPHLGPEFMMGILTFTKRFFEELCSRLKPPAVIVFDDYQEVSTQSDFHEVLNSGLSVLPDGISVIIMSRVNPPEAFSRLQLNRRMTVIGWESLRLDIEETESIGRLIKPSAMESHFPEELLQKTGGWLAGLILMLESIKKGELSAITLNDGTPEAIFAYFAHEVFSRADERMQSILLRTAFVSSFSQQMIEILAGKGSSRYGISNLVKGNFFIEVHGFSKKEYRYHPLFREFLLTMAEETFSEAESAHIRDLSSQQLLTEGRFDEAAHLLIEIEAWDKLSSIILDHAQELFVQGRLLLLKSWIACLPERMKTDQPWLSYWDGMCLLPFDQVAARNSLSRAFSQFLLLKDEVAFISSWSAIIESFIIDWSRMKYIDRWLKIFNEEVEPILENQEEDIRVTAISAYLHALTWRIPPGADIRRWVSVAEAAIYDSSSSRNIMKLAGALIQSYAYGEKSYKGRHLMDYVQEHIEKDGADPVMTIQYYVMKSFYSCFIGDHVKGNAAFEAGLKIIEETGIRNFELLLFFYHVHNVVAQGDRKKLTEASERLRKIPAQGSFKQSHFNYAMGALLLALNDVKGAQIQAREALEVVKKTGAPVPVAVIMLALGTIKCRLEEYDESLKWFLSARRVARDINIIFFHALLYEGFIHFIKGNESRGLDLLKKGLIIGAKEGFLMMAYFDRPLMNRIFSLAMEMELEKDYTREFIRKNRLLPVTGRSYLKDWPWPVKVFTLGSFRIELDGSPLKEGRKSHHRLFNLLNALICLGGADVPSHRLADILWPDQDGDAAQSALDMGIHRLRKLLKSPEAIEVKHGAVSINRDICWIDALEFDALVKSYIKQRDNINNTTEIDHILSLYGGKLLPGLSDSEWTLSMRENLQSSYLKLLEKLGDIHEEAKDWDKALDCYSRAVEDNPLSEVHVRGLMRSFATLNRPSDAILVYQKFEEELQNNMGIDPSLATKSLLKEISSSS